MALLDVEAALPQVGPEVGSFDLPAGARARQPLVRQGVLGDLMIAATAASTVLLTSMAARPALVVLSMVVIWRAYSFAALPAFERARSFTPVLRFAQVLSVVAVAVVVAGVADVRPVHNASIVLAAVTAVAAMSTALHRVALRRTPAVLIGPATQVDELEQRWSDRRDVTVVDTYRWAGALDLSDHRPGIVGDVLAAVSRADATSVVLAGGSTLSSPAVSHLVWALQRAQVECLVVADVGRHAEIVGPRRIGDQVALALRAPTRSPASALAKSALDRSVAAVALVVLSPLLLVMALAVRWDSHGPAVFSQIRSGRDGRPFRMYKFRSMVMGAENRLGDLMERNEAPGPLFKIVDDPRITSFGRFLRRSSLDELLQLVNVVKGEMSLVGPRPALPCETATYDPWTWRRLHVKPGLTGLWQVSGRSTLTWEESVRKDLEYVNNQSLRLDFSILRRTVRAVFSGEGAH